MKVGGKLSYSTCSLNPIENESVIAAALKEYGDKIRLVKTELPGFRFQQGLKSWKFLVMKQHAECERIERDGCKESFFTEYLKVEDVPESMK